MYNNPHILADAARQHTQDLLEEASKRRLARTLRRRPRHHWPDGGRAHRA
jgi:hypothetical protein